MQESPAPPESNDLRRFSFQLLIGFPSAGLFWLLVTWWISREWIWGILIGFSGVGLVIFAICRISPRMNRGLMRFWGVLTRMIEALITALVLGSIYFLVVTPLAWLRRLFGKSPVQRRPDPSRETYWQFKGGRKGTDRASYFRQF